MLTLKYLIAILVSIIAQNVQLMNCAFPEPIGNYTNHKVLIKPDIYQVYWRTTKTDIFFEVHSKNGQDDRWTSFGLSPDGEMPYSDVVVYGYETNGSNFFHDAYINGSSYVLIDDIDDNNWDQTLLTINDGYMIAQFWRPLEQCDESDQDRNILPGVNKVIYAHGTIQNGSMNYHGPEITNRGNKALQILDSSLEKINIDNIENIETESFILNVNSIYLFFLIIL
jgi:hypothetical protein